MRKQNVLHWTFNFIGFLIAIILAFDFIFDLFEERTVNFLFLALMISFTIGFNTRKRVVVEYITTPYLTIYYLGLKLEL